MRNAPGRFRFVHAADLHLDSPMRGLGSRNPHLLPLFADATRRAFEALVDRTLAVGARLLIIAGDVYDGDWRDHGTGLFFARQVARLTRAGVRVVLVRGNHDAESVISRTLTLPEGVHVFSARRAETLDLPELGLALHGRSFSDRAVSENIALAYPEALAGRINIGVLHTSCDGRPDHAAYAPCTPADLAARAYDYWALGHIHAHEVIARTPSWVVFPGNLQGRHVREPGAKGAMLVEAEDGRITQVERLVVDVARWARIEVDVGSAADLAEVIAATEDGVRTAAGQAGERALAARVVLGGRTRAHGIMAGDRAGLRAEIQAAADRIRDDIGIESVELGTRSMDDAMADGAGGLLDPAALLDLGPAPSARLREALAEVGQRLPDEVRRVMEQPGLEARLLAEARDLALSRLVRPAD